MNIWLYLPEFYYGEKITRVMGDSINKILSEVESEVSEVSKVGDVAEMPYDLLIEWLRLNDISTTGSENLDRQLFKRYYSLMKRRGTLSAISRVIESGGSMYSVDTNKFNYSILKGTDKMMKYCKRMTNYHTFNPDMYCPGVFFIETTNLDAVTENPLLEKVFPAGCKYYVVRVLLPQTVFAGVSNLSYLREIDRHYFCNAHLRGITQCKEITLNAYSTLIGDVFRRSWTYFNVNSFETIDGDSNFYLNNVDISISKETDVVRSLSKCKDISRSVVYSTYDVSRVTRGQSIDLVKSILADICTSPGEYEHLLSYVKGYELDVSVNSIIPVVLHDKYKTVLGSALEYTADMSVARESYQVQDTDTFKDGFRILDVESMESVLSTSKGVLRYPSIIHSMYEFRYYTSDYVRSADRSSERYLDNKTVPVSSPLALLVKDHSSEYEYYDSYKSVWSYGTVGTMEDVDSEDTNPVSSVYIIKKEY